MTEVLKSRDRFRNTMCNRVLSLKSVIPRSISDMIPNLSYEPIPNSFLVETSTAFINP